MEFAPQDYDIRVYEDSLAEKAITMTDGELNMYAEMAHNGDPVAIEMVNRVFYKFMIFQANTFYSDSITASELISYGVLGLARAIEKHKVDDGAEGGFRRYAMTYIMSYMSKGFYSNHNTIKVPSNVRTAAKREIEENGKKFTVGNMYALFQNLGKIPLDECGRYDKKHSKNSDDDDYYKELEDTSLDVDKSAEELVKRALKKLPDDEYRYLAKASFGLLGEPHKTRDELVAEGHRMSHVIKARMMLATKIADDPKYRHLKTANPMKVSGAVREFKNAC